MDPNSLSKKKQIKKCFWELWGGGANPLPGFWGVIAGFPLDPPVLPPTTYYLQPTGVLRVASDATI